MGQKGYRYGHTNGNIPVTFPSLANHQTDLFHWFGNELSIDRADVLTNRRYAILHQWMMSSFIYVFPVLHDRWMPENNMIQSAECISSGKFNCVLAYVTNLVPHRMEDIPLECTLVMNQVNCIHSVYCMQFINISYNNLYSMYLISIGSHYIFYKKVIVWSLNYLRPPVWLCEYKNTTFYNKIG